MKEIFNIIGKIIKNNNYNNYNNSWLNGSADI